MPARAAAPAVLVLALPGGLAGEARADCGLRPFAPAEAPGVCVSRPFIDVARSGVHIAAPEKTPVPRPLPGRILYAGEAGD